MQSNITRLPALPLIVNDPYFSIWCAGDKLTDVETTHWAGFEKPLRGTAKIDGKSYRFLGLGKEEAMETVAQTVTPTATEAVFAADGVKLTLRFTTPLLLDNPDVLSMPATYVDITAESADGEAHQVSVKFFVSNKLCYTEKKGKKKKPMLTKSYEADGWQVAFTGQRKQGILSVSGDKIAIDWGYLYLAAKSGVKGSEKGLSVSAASA